MTTDDTKFMQKNLRYNYATKPKVLSSSSNRVRQILRTGNVDKVEKMIRDGYGYKLIGEFSFDPKIRNLLKSVPFYMARIDMLHDAVTRAQLRDVQILLNTTSPIYSALKPKPENLVLSKDNAGVGLLHKAVYYDYPHIIEWVVQNYPSSTQVRDKLGRIPLHYVNSTTDPERNWDLLIKNGSPIDVEDVNGRTPEYYLTNGEEIHLPGKIRYNELHDGGIVVKPSNIRIWIHDQDIARLREVIWEGHGQKLKTQTSNKSTVKKFLNAVPHIMAVIQEIHKAAIENDVNTLATLCRPPVPAVILKSKDNRGITALHKACGLGNSEVVDYIIKTYPEAAHIRDNDGRTSIHYAATFKQEQIYERLLKAGANENIIDKSGKTAKFYLSKTDDINIESLRELPPGPKAGLSIINSSFDWNILNTDNNAINNVQPSNPDLFLQIQPPKSPTAEESNGDELSGSDELTNIRDIASSTSDVGHFEERKEKSPSNWEHCHNSSSSIEDAVVHDEVSTSRTNFERASEVLGENVETDDLSFHFAEQVDLIENEAENTWNFENENKIKNFDALSDTTDLLVDYQSIGSAATENIECPQSLGEYSTTIIEDILNHKVTKEDELKAATKELIQSENLEKIGSFILAGYGKRLLHMNSKNPAIQELINQLPIYLKKIELIHRCCEIGNLEELQKYMDRRKFAVACENKTELYLTPLHIAVAQNKYSIARYLAGRFPETLIATDKLGRTPLHYAAMHSDYKFIYNMLLTLGADKTANDCNGYSPQFYYDQSDEKYHNELSEIIQKLKSDIDSSPLKMQETRILLDELSWNRTENEYLVSILDEALRDGLSAVARTKPSEPLKFLANYLYNYKMQEVPSEQNDTQPDTAKTNSEGDLNHSPLLSKERNVEVEEAELEDLSKVKDLNQLAENSDLVQPNGTRNIVEERDLEESPVMKNTKAFQPLSRDSYGRTAIHIAASKKQSRNALLQMLQDLNANIAYRDELYRTARDIAALSEIYENVKAIDEYVLQIAANGETDKIINILSDGYDHILEIETDEDIMDVVERRNHKTTLTVLKTIPLFEDTRERLHTAIKQGDKLKTMEMLRKCGKDAALMTASKNEMCRCSLHIAVLGQHKDIVKYLVKKFPETLHVGDNLNRTPLHYAMALDKIEEMANILIRAGAKRTAKDLKGRQPTYYYMNKEDIIRMQQEEIYLSHQNIGSRLRKMR